MMEKCSVVTFRQTIITQASELPSRRYSLINLPNKYKISVIVCIRVFYKILKPVDLFNEYLPSACPFKYEVF